jgi:membrane-bound lytic murein transglycosylase D
MKLRHTLFKKTLPASLALLFLGGCATDNAFWGVTDPQPEEIEAVASSDSNDNGVEEFASVTEARENAVHQSEEQALLDESLAAASQNDDTLTDDNNTALDDQQDELSTQDDENGADTAASDQAAAPGEDVVVKTETESSVSAANEPPKDIWLRLRKGFTLPAGNHAGVVAQRKWYTRHQSYLDRTFNRADPYFYQIVQQVEKRGMPLELALLPVVESAFQPFAYSHGRAAGLWQFIPGTARRYGLKINWWYDGRRDIVAATNAALDYLDSLHKRFNDDWLLALAAYNSGEGTVAHAIRYNKRHGRGTSFWDLRLPRETEGYVPKLLAIADIVADPDKYGIKLKPIDNTPRLTKVNIGSQLDLAVAADMAGMTLEQLYILNPAFNRWATPPNGPHRLMLPLDKADTFRQQLAKLPAQDRVKWVRHRIRQGETLGQIALHYKTTVKTIQTTNKIRGNMIRAGNYLIIPAASRSLSSYALSETQRLHRTQSRSHAGRKSTYLVKSGDTLWDISMAYKVSVRSLASWNGMATRDMLRPGQKLVIWSKSGNTTAPAANPLASTLTRKISYRVRNGDSLARISHRFNVTVSALKKWNPGARGKYIQPGQHLVVYVDVTKVAENI